MNIPGVDKLELGPAVITYSYKKGMELPSVGDIIKDERCRMEVIESNKEKRYIKVVLTSTESVNSRMERYAEELNESKTEIASMLYKRTTSGMKSLIEWEDVTEQERDNYLRISEDILDFLNENKLLILQY